MTTDAKTMAKQAVAGAATGTAIEKHNDSAKTIEATFREIMPKLAQASLAKMPPEFIVSTAMTVLRNSEQLRECDPLSVVHCVVQSAQTGLRLDPVLQQAALVARWNSQKRRTEAQFMPMYKGLLQLARRSGKIVHVAAQPVYAKDAFSYEYGSDQKLVHKPNLAERGEPTHYYAYIKLVGGGFQFEVMTQEEIDEVKEFALKDKKNKDRSPWTTDPIPMALKTVLRRLLKLAPVEDPMLSAAIQADEMLERGVPQEHVVESGLVVPGGTYQDPDPEATPEVKAEATPEVKVEAAPVVAEPEPEPEIIDPTDQKLNGQWLPTAIRVIKILGEQKNRERANMWGREGRARFADGRLTQKQFDSLKDAYNEAFPPTGLFDQRGEPKPEHKVAPEAPAPKKEKRAKKAAVVSAKEYCEQITTATKLGPLFTLKGAIEKSADLSPDEKKEVLELLDQKFQSLKGKKVAS